MTTPLSDLTFMEHDVSTIRFPNRTLATCTDWDLSGVLMREALDRYDAEQMP